MTWPPENFTLSTNIFLTLSRRSILFQTKIHDFPTLSQTKIVFQIRQIIFCKNLKKRNTSQFHKVQNLTPYRMNMTDLYNQFWTKRNQQTTPFSLTRTYNQRQNCWDIELKLGPPPLHSKLGCLMFSIRSSHSSTTLHWEDGVGKALFFPFEVSKTSGSPFRAKFCCRLYTPHITF